MKIFVVKIFVCCENVGDENVYGENVYDENVCGENVCDGNVCCENVYGDNVCCENVCSEISQMFVVKNMFIIVFCVARDSLG